MLGVDRGISIFPKVVLLDDAISAGSSVKVAIELDLTLMAVDGPGSPFFLFRRCGAVKAIITTDVYVLVISTLRQPRAEDIMAHQLGSYVVGVVQTIYIGGIVTDCSQMRGLISKRLHVWQGQAVRRPIHLAISVVLGEIVSKSLILKYPFISQKKSGWIRVQTNLG